jgi:16S rRNA (guanine966-N2)-methyltransferase
MRIISGTHGGRKINPPASMPHTRPTTDIAKEGLFNILQNNLDWEEMQALELFGGTGSISYELASRGVPSVTVVEKDPAMYAFIQKTTAQLGLGQIKAVKMDALRYLDTCALQYDFIFADPPYAWASIDELPRRILEKKLLRPGGWLVLEHTTHHHYKDTPFYVTERNYGTTIFSIFIDKEG